MTVSSLNNRNGYTGNDTTATYSYTFKVFLDADVLVTVKNDTTDVETTLVESTDYTVTGAGAAAGGTVVLVDAGQAWISASSFLDTGYSLTLRRVLAVKQLTDIRNQGPFLPEIHEDEYDKSRMIDQQQQDEIDRSVKLPESLDPSTFDANLPTPEAGKYLVINGTNDGFALGGSSVSNIDDAAIAADADITRTKLAPGTADYVVVNDGSGEMSEEQYLAKAKGGAGASMASVTFPTTGTLATIAGAETITNKDIDGGTASNTNRVTVPGDTKANLDGLTRKEGTLVYATDENKLYADNGTTLAGVAPSIVYIKDVKTAGTGGGTFTLGAWRDRVLNTSTGDTSLVLSLVSNEVELAAGTYHIKATGPAANCNEHKLKWYNTTDAADELIGGSYYANQANSGASNALLEGVFTIAATKKFKLQHQSLATGVFGHFTNVGVVEIYAQIVLTKY